MTELNSLSVRSFGAFGICFDLKLAIVMIDHDVFAEHHNFILVAEQTGHFF